MFQCLPLRANPRADLGFPAAVHTSVKTLTEGLKNASVN